LDFHSKSPAADAQYLNDAGDETLAMQVDGRLHR
jgi:hypothetical protein